jgi:hypothetical protein
MSEIIHIEAVGNHYLYDSKVYGDTDGLGQICRTLKDSVSAGSIAHVYRGEVLCLVVDIHERADKALSEPAATGFRYQKYKPKTWRNK